MTLAVFASMWACSGSDNFDTHLPAGLQIAAHAQAYLLRLAAGAGLPALAHICCLACRSVTC